MPQTSVNRWLVLISSVLCNVCIGSAYAWSVFQKPLISQFGWSTSDASLAFTLSLSLVPIAMIFAGKMQDQQGPKKVIFFGGILFAAGIVGAGFIDSLTGLYCTYGVLGGFGIGTIYACTVANTVKFFPDKRGLASGLVVAGFGSGAVLLAPVSSSLIASYGVLTTFQYLGVAYLIVICSCSLMIATAPTGYTPPGWTPPAPAAGAAAVSVDKNWREMVADPMFYILWVIYTVGCISGLMIIGHASPITQEVIKQTPQTAAMVVGLLALANTAGRIFWGAVSDKIGRYPSVMCMFVISGLMMLAITQVNTFGPFVCVLLLVGLCFGGVMGIFPSITADNFGPKNLGMNYGVIFTAYGVAAFAGPRLAARMKELNNGDYTQAFLIAAGLCALGIVLVFVAMQKKKKLAA